MKFRYMDGASAETLASCAPLWSHDQCQVATMKSRTILRTKAGHHIRLRMRADHLFCQSLYQTYPYLA